MSNVLVTLEEKRHGDTLCRVCESAVSNTRHLWQARHALTRVPIGVPTSAAPFLAACRVLLAQGYNPDDVAYLVDVGATDTSCWRLRGTIGVLSGWTVEERDGGDVAIYLARNRGWGSASTSSTQGEAS